MQIISTHALTEGDFVIQNTQNREGISTHALTEGDDVAEMAVTCCDISTHALTEGDRSLLHTNSLECHFNSRPHGGRPTMIVYPSDDLAFQLTPSRRATFSICPNHCTFHFNSRPHGGRRWTMCRKSLRDSFQLTPSRRATLRPDAHTLRSDDSFQLTPSRRATANLDKFFF